MKKIWLWNLIPIIISIIHIAHNLPGPLENIVFNMLVNFNYLFYFASGLYYFFINYCFYKESMRKAFLFSLLGLSIWWSIDMIMYFAVGDVDGVGRFLLVAFAVYNYLALSIVWAIKGIVHWLKKANKMGNCRK